jgi:hypothetical protein
MFNNMRKLMALLLAAALAAAGAPPGNAPRVKVALYLDIGCKGGGVIHWAQLLKSSPDVECCFIDAADVHAGRLDGCDVLVMPGGSGYER